MKVKYVSSRNFKPIDWSKARSRNLSAILDRMSNSTSREPRKTSGKRSFWSVLGKFCSL